MTPDLPPSNHRGRMLSVAEALESVLAYARPAPTRRLGLRSSLGLVLAENIHADMDLPPFDKALVDGYAVRSADFSGSVSVRLRIIEDVFAGDTPTRTVVPGTCIAIMTGAPLPEGSDAVVMVEKTRRDGDFTIISGPVPSGGNRLVRGREMRVGDIVVPAGSTLGPGTLGVLASVGRGWVDVRPRPIVAVVATGDELVPYDEIPGPGRIRNSNTMLLSALTEAEGGIARPLPIVPDRSDALRKTFVRCLEGDAEFPDRSDILLVSGGVSAGRRDLVPEALEAVGVRNIFHKVRVKPGKPLWFGVGPDRTHGPPALVFGLPGNPVSGLVSFLLFVRPAIHRLTARAGGADPSITLPLATTYEHQDDRDSYRPARLIRTIHGSIQVEPLPWAGSSDLRAAAQADGFAIFPAGERIYLKGEPIGFLSVDPSRFPRGNSY